MSTLPSQVIVRPHIIYDFESSNPQDDYPDGKHMVKVHARSTSDLFFGSDREVRAWLAQHGYVKTEELTRRMFSSEVDGIYTRSPQQDQKPAHASGKES